MDATIERHAAVVKRVDVLAYGEREKLFFAAPQRAARIGGTRSRSSQRLTRLPDWPRSRVASNRGGTREEATGETTRALPTERTTNENS
jgi:hypothetical protein